MDGVVNFNKCPYRSSRPCTYRQVIQEPSPVHWLTPVTFAGDKPACRGYYPSQREIFEHSMTIPARGNSTPTEAANSSATVYSLQVGGVVHCFIISHPQP